MTLLTRGLLRVSIFAQSWTNALLLFEASPAATLLLDCQIHHVIKIRADYVFVLANQSVTDQYRVPIDSSAGQGRRELLNCISTCVGASNTSFSTVWKQVPTVATWHCYLEDSLRLHTASHPMEPSGSFGAWNDDRIRQIACDVAAGSVSAFGVSKPANWVVF